MAAKGALWSMVLGLALMLACLLPFRSKPMGGGTGRLAFTASQSGQYIHVWEANTTYPLNSQSMGCHERDASWSADGQHIAFVLSWGRNCRQAVYTANADGSQMTRLESSIPAANKPVWSPGGKHIVLTSTTSRSSEIYVVDANGANMRRLSSQRANDHEPAWSPDGRGIAFSSLRSGNIDIYVMNADGTGRQRLTDHMAMDSQPAWSPDGRQIAFVSSRDGSFNTEIYLMNADGSAARNLTRYAGADQNPAWSPDGSLIAFASNREGRFKIYVMDIAHNLVLRITDPGLEAQHWSPVWQPGS